MNSEQAKPEGQPVDETQQPEPSAGKEPRKAASDASKAVSFYPPAVVASILTALLLQASPDGETFGSFENQLEAALNFAKSSKGDGANEYAQALTAVRDFWLDDANKDLFLIAHLGIKQLLTRLANSEDVLWSDCKFVSQATIKDIFNLRPR